MSSNQWQPYAYKDCSLQICSLYCPQWCYLILPPPPPFGYATTDFSPLIIATIGVLATAFILVIYYTVISKFCNNRPATEANDEQQDSSRTRRENRLEAPPGGLDEALVKFITVCKYKSGDGLVEGTDCSVCLSEFEENESLRLLPNCSHAFHLPCIDTWLKSHTTCPLCRSNISPTDLFAPPVQEIQRSELSNSSGFRDQHGSNDAVVVVVVRDLQGSRVSQETDAGGSSRSESHTDKVSVADMVRASQDGEEDELQKGIGSSKVSVQEHCHEMNRSIPAGKLDSTNLGKGKSCIIPS